MSEKLMTTKEVAAYLQVHEKYVYIMAREKRIPATRVTGKWIFPQRLIDDWIESDASRGLKQAMPKNQWGEEVLLVSGSSDPLLGLILSHTKKTHPEVRFFVSSTSSVEGLRDLDLGHTDIAWSHLFDPDSGDYNLPFLPTYLPDIEPVVINVCYQDLGFLAAANNPLGVKGFRDLPSKGMRFVNRQKGSGTREFIDRQLVGCNIDPAAVEGYDHEVFSHIEVGLSIRSGESDIGIATTSVAQLLGLSFVPVSRARFDMILEQHTYFQNGVQALTEVLRSDSFREGVAKLGYDLKDSGKILWASRMRSKYQGLH
jgi:putative molybdopterin biosynthesis protein